MGFYLNRDIRDKRENRAYGFGRHNNMIL